MAEWLNAHPWKGCIRETVSEVRILFSPHMIKKPKIGIVLDKEPGGGYSEYPYYVLREHYFNAVVKAGGIPVGIDHTVENIDDYVALLDGLLMPGGDYDIPPSVYGENEIHESVVTKVGRLDFDWKITQKFLDADKPILGICAGEQLLAVMLGGTLVQHIETEIDHYLSDRERVAHDIKISEGTLLHKIIGATTLGVNSHHHQSVKTISDKFVASACSSDGIIEAIEVKDKKFCLGVQWHPEFLNDSDEFKIFEAFVEACKKNI
jgi:putative glutamine amidotransferase